MPVRRYTRGFGRRRGALSLNVINSIKNVHNESFGITSSSTVKNLAKAVTSPSPTVSSDVSHGCMIRAIFISLDFCGLGGTGVINNGYAYLFKNPGNNLTAPSPIAQGTSNEKKFIIKTWNAMIMRNQDGNVPYHWEGWIKIPRRYQRMGTDDTWQFVIQCTAALTGHAQFQAIYKWYR